MLIDEFLCKREVLGKRAPHSFTPPSKCGRCVQHILLFGTSNTSKKPKNFYFSNQVYHRNAKEVWNGILQTSCKLRKDDDSKSIDQRQYRSMIGSLLYVTESIPDVMHVVGHVA
jgi:hypothetical protein